MAKKKAAMKTAVALVLDETGSMYGTAPDTRGAVNQYFAELAQETPEALVALMEFSSMGAEPTFRPLCSGVAPSAVPELTEQNYRPRGNTPLYDAIAHAILETEKVEAEKYLLVILTDGQENSSTEYTLASIKQLIERKQGEGWTIVYLGANQDAWKVGGAMGFYEGNTMSYAQTAGGVRATTRSLAHATSAHAHSDAVSTMQVFADAGQSAADYQEKETDLWVPKKKED